MPKYESTGTIRYSLEKNSKSEILFNPDDDHCVKHNEVKYAVFLCVNSKDSRKVIVKRLKEEMGSVRLRNKNLKIGNVLKDASMKQIKIDVKIKCKGGKKLKLTGITLPARSAK